MGTSQRLFLVWAEVIVGSPRKQELDSTELSRTMRTHDGCQQQSTALFVYDSSQKVYWASAEQQR